MLKETQRKLEILKLVFGPEFKEHLQGESVITSSPIDGIWHDSLELTECLNSGRRENMQNVQINDIDSSDLCPTCFAGRGGTSIFHTSLKYQEATMLALDILWLRELKEKGGEVNFYDKVFHLSRLREIQDRSEEAIRNHPGLCTFGRKVGADVKERIDRLVTTFQREEFKSQLALMAANRLLPQRLQDKVSLLDNTPILIGISPANAVEFWDSDDVSTVYAAVTAYSIYSNDNKAVLYVPAFFYAFFCQAMLKDRTGRHPLIVSAPGGDGEASREAAAHLWEPDGEGPLASLCASMESAMALED